VVTGMSLSAPPNTEVMSGGQPEPSGLADAVVAGRLEKGMPSYSELLKDPRWQKMRLKKLEAAAWSCELCCDTETMLSVHHKRYVKGRMPWEYDEVELVVLCQPCHEETHEDKNLQAAFIARLDVDGPMSVGDFFAYGAGALDCGAGDSQLSALLAQLESDAPCQFAAGRIIRNLSLYGLTAEGFQKLSKQLDPDSLDESLFGDLLSLFQKHGIRMHGERSA